MKRADLLAFVREYPGMQVADLARAFGVSCAVTSIAVCRLRDDGYLDPAYAMLPWDASTIMPGWRPRCDLGADSYGLFAFACDVGGTLDEYAETVGWSTTQSRSVATMLRLRGALAPSGVVVSSEYAAALRDAAWDSLRTLEQHAKENADRRRARATRRAEVLAKRARDADDVAMVVADRARRGLCTAPDDVSRELGIGNATARYRLLCLENAGRIERADRGRRRHGRPSAVFVPVRRERAA